MDEAKLAKILIVDNDKDFCNVLENTLTLEGCNVDSVFFGEDALHYVEERYYDVVIIDLNLPDLNGMRLMKRLKEMRENIQVLIISSADSAGCAVEAIKSGAFDYITKPIMFDEILLSIKKAIKQKQKTDKAKEEDESESLVGATSELQKVRDLIKKVAPTDTTVLILGESGTGKEIIAQEIYRLSERQGKPFVKISCAALPETLLESELFGYEKGAFTGAQRQKKGLFEVADGGTLFLDEITEVSLGIQAKLLRALQEKEIKRLGDTKDIAVDVRFIAASNKNIHEEISAGRFRQDLYYRLNVINIQTTPLRERKDDIEPLCFHFIKKYKSRAKDGEKSVSKEVMNCFMRYDWPGNVRELENVIERAMVLGMGSMITLGDIPDRIRSVFYEKRVSSKRDFDFEHEVDLELEIETLERELISKALDKAGGVVSKAAKLLKIKRTTLIAKMKKYEIK
ncbi:MAG: sigma-54-dependent Fis family transcriptional regulator [Candidatus Omnitrophica bacterium]|nr:sigma-54-dependent Fis family transcriptional regulator [Candidatus Omnitrophota bacterium]